VRDIYLYEKQAVAKYYRIFLGHGYPSRLFITRFASLFIL